jgi:hypothetical protein
MGNSAELDRRLDSLIENRSFSTDSFEAFTKDLCND